MPVDVVKTAVIVASIGALVLTIYPFIAYPEILHSGTLRRLEIAYSYFQVIASSSETRLDLAISVRNSLSLDAVLVKIVIPEVNSTIATRAKIPAGGVHTGFYTVFVEKLDLNE